VRVVACDGVEAKRQERLEYCGVVDRAGRDAESDRSEGCDQRRGRGGSARRIGRRIQLAGGVVGAAAVVAVVLIVALGRGSSAPSPQQRTGSLTLRPAFDSMAKLPGLQRGAPLWTAGSTDLQPRLRAIGLPALTAEGTVLHIHQHLDLYINGQHPPVPAKLGIDPGGAFISPLHTHDTTGVIHVESPTQSSFTLGQFFAVWGVPLARDRLGSAPPGGGQLRVWVNGKPLRADPTRVELASHQEIVVAYGSPAQMQRRPLRATPSRPACSPARQACSRRRQLQVCSDLAESEQSAGATSTAP
jgi:hypothetical protein